MQADPNPAIIRGVVIDLHLHSNHSDGSDAPHTLIDRAHRNGVTALSLTDHDTVSGIPAAHRRADELGIEFISGIELSCHTSERTVHLLGYGIDTTRPELLELLAGQQRSRGERNALLVDRLTQLGYPLTIDEVHAQSGDGSVGRPHFAAVLVQKGYMNSIDEAFTQLLGAGCPAYIERRELSAADAIQLVHESGGVAIWAHPTRHHAVDERRFHQNLEELIAAKLDGFECWYSRFTPDQRRRMVRTARKHGLIPTGGSDYHGTYKPDLDIGVGTGDLQIPHEVFRELCESIEEIRK